MSQIDWLVVSLDISIIIAAIIIGRAIIIAAVEGASWNSPEAREDRAEAEEQKVSA
jgi:hypothetical protein